MVGGEKIVEAGRTDEILIESHQLTGIAVSEAKVKVDNLLGTHSDLRRDQSHYSLVVLAEDLCLALKVLLQMVLHCFGVEDWLEVVLLVGFELLTL